MRHTVPSTLALLALAGGGAAQSPGSGPPGPSLQNRPAFSPYLTLARAGSPAVNYYGIVRPLQQQQQALSALQQAAGLPNPFAAADAGDAPAVTGNPFGFQNYRLYFQNQYLGGVGPGGGGTGGGQRPTGPAGPTSPPPTPAPRKR